MKIVIASGGNGESGASIAAKRHIDVMRNIEDLDIRVYSKFSYIKNASNSAQTILDELN